MTASLAADAGRHLLREDGQEDVCFALYRTSTGKSRVAALPYRLVLPAADDRKVHGNVEFSTEYLRRALAMAVHEKAGLALLHSHPAGKGWQGLSPDDRLSEHRHAGSVWARSGLPLVGCTVAGDGSWSARFWERTTGHDHIPVEAANTRVVGAQLRVTSHPSRLVATQNSQVRTESFWGTEAQSRIAGLRVAVVGLGSVGSIVAELLARVGVRELILLDFDRVKLHNLDRTLGATAADAKLLRPKVEVAARQLRRSATAAGFVVRPREVSIVEDSGYREVLDADVVFSCVDRPWARHVLNRAAYAHLLPVIDGGILVRFAKGTRSLLNADWSTHIAGPERPCLICRGAYTPELVSLEQTGLLDDPSYLDGLPDDSPLKRRENIIPLSAAVASFEVMQLVAMVSALMNLPEIGQQRFAYYPGNVRVDRKSGCDVGCATTTYLGLGDTGHPGLGEDPTRAALEKEIAARRQSALQVVIQRGRCLLEGFRQYLRPPK